jgi:ABC-2 type transport system permease protein
MKPLYIAWTNLLRTLREPRGLFVLVVMPVILIVLLGMIYGGNSTSRIGVTNAGSGTLSQDLIAAIQAADPGADIRTYDTPADLRDAVERGYVEIGIAIPADFDANLRSGQQASIEYVGQPVTVASAVRTSVEQAVADEAALVAAARTASARTGVSFDTAYAAAKDRQQNGPRAMTVSASSVNDESATVSGYTLGAQTQLILFMFLSALTAALGLVGTRELGVSRRMFSTPTSVRTIIAGETLGRFVVSLCQGVFIVVFAWLVFGVNWVDPLATSAIVIAFALVATGAAMVVGAFAGNSTQVVALAPGIGMMLGLLGGTMVPPEIFPPVMLTISHVTPHAWALDGFRQLALRGGGLLAVLPEVGVLLLFAAALLSLAVVRFRRVLETTA